jgi:uncharacterized membrane-anchored protein
MQQIHLPTLGVRYWIVLCVASVFGANMGDFFAHNIGLGHVAGLPFLAAGLAIVMTVERFDRRPHEVYYWLAIIVVRTAATNFADFFSVDLRLQKLWVMAGLALLLIVSVHANWRLAAGRTARETGDGSALLRADAGYWLSMFLAGTLGTVIGDYCSHDQHLGDAWASVVLTSVLAVVFLIGRGGLLRFLAFYWTTIVAVRAAGTVVGDLFAERNMLGLPLSTLITGAIFVALLVLWKEPRKTALVSPQPG